MLELIIPLLYEIKREAREWGVQMLCNTDYTQAQHAHWKWKISLGRMLIEAKPPGQFPNSSFIAQSKVWLRKEEQKLIRKNTKGHNLILEECIKGGQSEWENFRGLKEKI